MIYNMAQTSRMIASGFVGKQYDISISKFLFNVDLDLGILINRLSSNINVGTGASSY